VQAAASSMHAMAGKQIKLVFTILSDAMSFHDVTSYFSIYDRHQHNYFLLNRVPCMPREQLKELVAVQPPV
jgi:hypothetical protein